MSEEGETVPSPVSELLTPIVTLAVGWLLSLTVNVAVPPASVVLPLMLLTVKPAVSVSPPVSVPVPRTCIRVIPKLRLLVCVPMEKLCDFP